MQNSSRFWSAGVAAFTALLIGFGIVALQAGPSEAKAAPTFVPFPCADKEWRNGDSRFAALPGAKAYFGSYAGGLYRIEIPEKWNGELVLWAHGYAGEGELLNVGTPPGGWRTDLIAQGYAWAASSYRCNGYVPGIGLQDTMLLTPLFFEINGKAPSRTYLTGQSMGGHITILGMQEFPKAFDGALALCPAGPGLFDYFTAMGAAAELVTGLKYSTSEPAATTSGKVFVATGLPPNLTAKGATLGSIMVNSSGGQRPFVGEGLATYYTLGVSGAKLSGATDFRTAAMTNDQWVYGIDPGHGLTAAEINAGVRRLPADGANRGEDTKYNEVKPFTGKVAKPIMTMHDTGDMFVPIFLERQYRSAVEKVGNGNLLTQRIYRTPQHCGYNAGETSTAFNDMVAWSKGGAKPAGDDVNADLSDAGKQFTSPLRPGDPGTQRIAPQPVVIAPLPPNTGNGLEESASSHNREVFAWMMIAVVATLGSGSTVLVLRRRRSRGE